VGRIDHYKPVSTYVLDPLEYTALGIQVAKKMNGEAKWKQIEEARWNHPDGAKSSCFINGAVIYVHLKPDRSAPGMRPPADWLHEAGITDASLWEARQLLDLKENFTFREEVRNEIFEQMDAAQLEDK